MDNNFNRIKKNTKHKSAGVHIRLNPLSASSSSEIMSNCRHYFDGFRVLQLPPQSMLLPAPILSRAS